MSTGKATEHETARRIRQQYKTAVSIQRLPDKFDTGKFEDTRPSDFLIILGRDFAKKSSSIYFVECKETEKPKTSFSILGTFRKGQVQGMVRAAQLSFLYFVVFHILATNQIYLVPGIEILRCLNEGKKSISISIIEQYPWKEGALYDYYQQRSN